ncbi:hypothetical protein NAPIS_ORF02095 [Vairimorpha apis BRL 01]|uniref:Uncharacterized protein n=1 Tax=Vairimorpha apis BRL 01 TaxID=1037528 RepID=T0L6N2_9MICR|nr:hypothetical protein NAPIS_ORF02095 [Vairimorpha apis BRL 01]
MNTNDTNYTNDMNKYKLFSYIIVEYHLSNNKLDVPIKRKRLLRLGININKTHWFNARYNPIRKNRRLITKKLKIKIPTNVYTSLLLQEVMENDQAEIRVDTRLVTDIKTKEREILIVEVGITNQDRLSLVENEKLRKYDLLANELDIIHKCKTRIVPYVMTWDARNPTKPLGIYTVLVLKKTLESISLERRQGHDWRDAVEKLLIRKPYEEEHGEEQIVNLNSKNININLPPTVWVDISIWELRKTPPVQSKKSWHNIIRAINEHVISHEDFKNTSTTSLLTSIELRSDNYINLVIELWVVPIHKTEEEMYVLEGMNSSNSLIKTRTNHGKLYKARDHEQRNNQARSEAVYSFLQYRNIFSVDYLATKHNEIEIMENNLAELSIDTRIGMDIKVSHNKPDILVFDKKRKEILIVEVGITNLDRSSIIFPYVITSGCVIKIKPFLEAYIHSIVLLKTLELDNIRDSKKEIKIMEVNYVPALKIDRAENYLSSGLISPSNIQLIPERVSTKISIRRDPFINRTMSKDKDVKFEAPANANRWSDETINLTLNIQYNIFLKYRRPPCFSKRSDEFQCFTVDMALNYSQN